jgi:hypothetical protein
MSTFKILWGVFLGCFLILTSCLEPYDPPKGNGNSNFLVVDGFLNSTDGTALVSLSYSVSLDNPNLFVPGILSTVTVNDEHGHSWLLQDTSSNGTYVGSGIPFDQSHQYNVEVKTGDDRRYASEYIQLTSSPPIDSITWAAVEDKVEVSVNTHDPSNASRYYRWRYHETYEYTSKYSSLYIKLSGKDWMLRPADQSVYRCWKTNPERTLLVGTTRQLSEDVVSHQKIKTIYSNSLEMQLKYSIEVEQEVLSEEAYDYWINVRKTSESLGGLFDPLPGQVIGNVKSLTNPDEKVIGFVTGGSIAKQRIYIRRKDLPPDFPSYMFPGECKLDTALFGWLDHITEPNTLVNPLYWDLHPIEMIGFYISRPECVDCRLSGGGSLTKPPFWKD